MQIIVLGTVFGLAALAILKSLSARPNSARARVRALMASLPALLVLGLFYSLAIHMYFVLGGFPSSIGENGFPSALVTHSRIAYECFKILVMFSVFVWPPLFLICCALRQWRRFLLYHSVYVFCCVVSFCIMMLAPSKFLNWWWD